MVTIHSLTTELIPIFPTAIGITSRDNTIDDLCIASALIPLWQNEGPGTAQTPNGIHLMPELEQLNQHIFDSVVSYLRQHDYKFNDSDLYIAASWANCNQSSALPHPMHRHANSLVSVVYYISTPSGSGSLILDHPNSAVNMLSPEIEQSNTYNSFKHIIPAEQGKCVIFKSAISHGTTPHLLSPEDSRISIAYTFNLKNIGPSKSMGNYEQL